MNCPGEESLSAYMDGETSLQEQDGIVRHLADCRRCREKVALVGEMKGRLSAMRFPECPPKLLETLAEFSESVAVPAPPPGFGRRSFAWGFPAALALAAAILWQVRTASEKVVPEEWLAAEHRRFAASLPLSGDGLVPEEAPFYDD